MLLNESIEDDPDRRKFAGKSVTLYDSLSRIYKILEENERVMRIDQRCTRLVADWLERESSSKVSKGREAKESEVYSL